MARKNYDFVIEAVHYTPTGDIDWVRGYMRRGVVFSDRVIWHRQQLVAALKEGKRILSGRRKPFFGNDFETQKTVRLIRTADGDIITTRSDTPTHDDLEDLPRI